MAAKRLRGGEGSGDIGEEKGFGAGGRGVTAPATGHARPLAHPRATSARRWAPPPQAPPFSPPFPSRSGGGVGGVGGEGVEVGKEQALHPCRVSCGQPYLAAGLTAARCNNRNAAAVGVCRRHRARGQTRLLRPGSSPVAAAGGEVSLACSTGSRSGCRLLDVGFCLCSFFL